MYICDGIMVDEPCTRKSFQENRWIQQLETHVFWWMITFLYGLQQCLMFASKRGRRSMRKMEEDQILWKTEDEDKKTRRWKCDQFKGELKKTYWVTSIH
jgi:hypothetical protein